MGDHRYHQRRDEGRGLWPAGAVLCHEHFPDRRQFPGLSAPGICTAAFHPLCAGKAGRRLRYGNYDRHFLRLRRYRADRHGRYRRYGAASIAVPQEIVDAIEGVGFLASIPLWLVSLLGSLFITVMSFILILTVYGRFFRLYFYTALAPLPLASFAGEGTSFAGSAFLKSYVGVCLEGAIIVLACLIFSAFMSSGTPVVDTSLSAVTMSWQYIGETIFNMMVLVGLVKGAERIVKEMFGL